MDVVARFSAQLSECRILWRAGRWRSLTTLSALRCDGEMPLIGEDAVRSVTIEQPISQVRALID